MPAKYVVRSRRGGHIAEVMQFENATLFAKSYMNKTGDKNVDIYTLSHTVEQNTERVPIEWETRTTLDVKKV